MVNRPWLRGASVCFAVILLVAACAPLISPYQEESYKYATSLKARSLALIAKSGTPFSQNRELVDQLLVDVDAAYEYAKGLPRNQLVTEQWQILRNPNGELLGGFVRIWRQKSTLSQTFRSRLSALIGSAFDEIICLEVNKKSATSCG